MDLRHGFAVLIASAASLTAACAPERITLLDAGNLREALIVSTNEHDVLLDVVMPEDDFRAVRQQDAVLEYSDCGSRRGGIHHHSYGVIQSSRPIAHRGRPAELVTFSLFRTSVADEAAAEMSVIRCVWLTANRGYGLRGYYSDPIRVRLPS